MFWLGQKIYALSPQAVQQATRRVEHSAWVVAAKSIEEAEGLGLTRALELWPRERGWSGHDASPVELVFHSPETERSLTTSEGPDTIM
jgi:hypothetical protein